MSDAPRSRDNAPARTFRWGFPSAMLAVLVLIVLGEAVGRLAGEFPPARALRESALGRGVAFGDVLGSMIVRDWLFVGFLLAALFGVFASWGAVKRFFRSMHVGVSLVSLTTLAVAAGVLVPQIQNFEDPDERVTPENYESNYDQFRWAEGYFLYHLVRPYGIGMPKPEIPQTAVDGIERYARAYGKEEAKNRRILMKSAFSGQEKTAEIEEFIVRNDALFRRAFDVVTFLDLNRAYKSNWFKALLFLLGTSVAFNTFKAGFRRSFTIHKIGFVTTHFGILTMLAGGFVSNQLTERGMLNLFTDGGPDDVYLRHYRRDKLARLPFKLRLDHFARKEWMALEVHLFDADISTRVPRYTLWEGAEVPVDWVEDPDGEWRPRVLLRVAELYDHARVGVPTVREADADDPDRSYFPVAELEVPNDERDAARMEGMPDVGGPTRRVLLSPMLRTQGYFDPERGFRLVASYGADPRSLFPPAGSEELGTLDVQVLGTDDITPIPVRIVLGERVELPGGYAIQCVDATTDFRPDPNQRRQLERGSNHPLPLEQQPDGYAAIWMDIFPPDGGPPERRLVIEVVDAIEHGLQESYEYEGLVAKLRWDRWSAPGPPRYVLSWGEDVEPVLVGEDGTRRTVRPDEPLDLPGGRTIPRAFYDRARFEKDIEFLPTRVREDGWNESFYVEDARGLVLDVIHEPGTDAERVERVEMATTEVGGSNLWFSGDERFALKFLENTEGFPYDWRSVLSVVETDADGREYTVELGSEVDREIRVNNYFKHRGWRFFQTNAEPTMPTYSGIGVVYDPGIPIVITGMTVIILGTFLAFVVRPIVLNYSKRRKGAAA